MTLLNVIVPDKLNVLAKKLLRQTLSLRRSLLDERVKETTDFRPCWLKEAVGQMQKRRRRKKKTFSTRG